MTNFKELALPEALLNRLSAQGFETPTPIQQKAIPLAAEGHDILASAQTGTGKTGAFSIPILANLLTSQKGAALIIAPTRELATQVHKEIGKLIPKKASLSTGLLIGGESYSKQFAQLKRNPRIIIATPGRLNDHLERGSIDLSRFNYLVLDETDRMLDMGFSQQIERVLKHMPDERQTLLFSATMPKNIMFLARNYLKDPKRIQVASENKVASNVTQKIVEIDESEKLMTLQREIEGGQGTVIVFVKTKFGTERIAKKLEADGIQARAFHGDLKQSKRTRILEEFRREKFRVLVATDVAARGLDISHIAHVINFHLPQVPEDYIHRIGRTARAGAKGNSITFVTPSDVKNWNRIAKILHTDGEDSLEIDISNHSDKTQKNKKTRKFHTQKPRFSRSKDAPKGAKPKRFQKNRKPKSRKPTAA